MLLHYVPQTPAMLPDGAYEDVTEPIELMLYAANTAAAQELHRRLEAMLQAAMQRQKAKNGPRVYLRFQPSGDAFLWRSEVKSGQISLGSNSMSAWGQAKIEVRLIVTRQPFWERDAETEVRLSSFMQPLIGTGGRSIRNHSDTQTTGNYVDIGPSDVAGSLPAPARIELQNLVNASRMYSNIYIANEVLHTSHNYAYMVQGENHVSTSGGTALTGYTGASGGGVLQLSFSGITTPRWAYGATAIRAAAGKTYRLLVRFNWYTIMAGNTIYVEPRIVDPVSMGNFNPYGVEKALPTPQSTLIDVGSLSFGDFEAAGAVHTMLAFRSAAQVLVEIDYLQPMPADNFRHLVYLGGGVPNGGKVVDDGPEDRAYELTTGGNQLPTVSARSKPIMLWPQTGFTQRIYVLQDRNGVSTISDTFSVQIFYRPRRLTI